MKVSKVISGGQTGADQAGLFAGKELKLETGGVAPKGWRTQKGPAKWLSNYGLKESASSAYPPRTEMNVCSADITLIFGDDTSPGCKLTKKYCMQHNKPFCVINDFNNEEYIECYRKIMDYPEDDLIINIAGNREESNRGITKKTKKFLVHLIAKVNKDYEK